MEMFRSQYEDVEYPGCIKGVQMLPRLLSLVWMKHMVWALTGGGAEPPGSNRSIRGK